MTFNFANNVSSNTVQVTKGSGSAMVLDLNYEYDAVGNITKVTNASLVPFEEVTTYGYDSLDRLVSAGVVGGYSQAWTYNPIGNIKSLSENGGPATTYYYQYDPNDPHKKPHAVTQVGSRSYGYDANGNMVSRAGEVLQYDWENRLTLVASGGVTTTYVYDGDGQRASKTVAANGTFTTTYYVGNWLEVTGGVTTTYYYLAQHQTSSSE